MTVFTVENIKREIEKLNKYLETANRNCSWAKHAEKQIDYLENLVTMLERN